MITYYPHGVKCRETYQGAFVSFTRFLDLSEEDRRIIGEHVLGFAVSACRNEGKGRNPIMAAVRFLQSIEDGVGEILYGYDGFAEIRRCPNIRVVH